jgi:hypothetical protein
MTKLIGSIFSKSKIEGDFGWMIHQPQYSNTLFLYNDDIENTANYSKGNGNAIVRPYNQHNLSLAKPQSAGIPTGSKFAGGFSQLDSATQKYIDDAIQNIRELIRIHDYDSIIYSMDKNGKLGTGMFRVDNDVVDYITKQIKTLV